MKSQNKTIKDIIYRESLLPKIKNRQFSNKVIMTDLENKRNTYENTYTNFNTNINTSPFKLKNNNIKVNLKNRRKESLSFSNFSKLRKDIAMTTDISDRILKGYKRILKRSVLNTNADFENKDKNENILNIPDFTLMATDVDTMNNNKNTNLSSIDNINHIYKTSYISQSDKDNGRNENKEDNYIRPPGRGNSKIKKSNFTYSSLNKSSICQNGRTRLFKITFIPKYNQKKNLSNVIIPKNIIQNLDYQSGAISDEIKVLLDSIDILRFSLFNSPCLNDVFKSISNIYKQEINLLLEETSGLMMEISQIILSDYSKFLDKIISVLPPSNDRFKVIQVKNEETILNINIRLFSDISLYMKGCYEVYLVLLKQEDDICLNYIKFMELMQFLTRARLNVTNLIFRGKTYINNYNDDKLLVDKYLDEREFNLKMINTINAIESQDNLISLPKSNSLKGRNFKFEQKLNLESNEKVKKGKFLSVKYSKVLKKKPNREYNDLSEKIRNQFNYKLNEQSQKMKRLNAILTNNETNDDREEFLEKSKQSLKTYSSCLNSNLINKLMKFIPIELKHKIISQRIIERYKEKNENSSEYNDD